MKLAVTALALAVLVFAALKIKEVYFPKYDGKITVEVVDLGGTRKKTKQINFNTGDALVKLLEENFTNVKMENGMLMTIETLETPEDWSSFICVYVDDKMSEVGIEEIKFKDGTKISLVMTPLSY